MTGEKVQGVVYVTRRVPEPGVKLLREAGLTLRFWDSDEAIPREELLKNVAGVDALLCMLTDPIDAAVLDAAGPQLRVVATMSVGYEHIALEECRGRGIVVANTPNVSTDSVAELTVALLLFTARRMGEGLTAVRDGTWGEWKPTWLCGRQLFNSTVGIYGLGRIGFGVACRLLPFGIKRLIYHDVVAVSYASEVRAEFVEFEELLAQSDFLVVCCNLTPQTRHRLNAEAFRKMKNTAVVVNSGRGGVINHDDLLAALQTGQIMAAGLDVTEPEPLPPDHPLVSLSNCVVLPHMGSNTWDTRNLMSETAAKNIISVFRGEQVFGRVV